MNYTRYDEISPPPPLDYISSAGGTEGDLEDFDLDINGLSAVAANSQKHYKSFQPSIKLQPADVVYREDQSRAAPRKGIEPKAFLAIGETKQEHVEYVGRQKVVVTAPTQQGRQTLSASPRKYGAQRRQASVYSAPPTNRNRSRISRNTSGKGRQSVWSSPGYTPLPVAPPPNLPPRENAYIIHPFKQDQSANAQALDPTSHQLATMEGFLANLTYQNTPSRCSSAPSEIRRPVSPGEEMKQATILATMEVGRYLNQREKTPKVSKYRESKLLKARLRPLSTVKVDGPSIHQCQGVQADRRRFGPSPVKAKQQQQLDDIIQKSAAIKDMPSATYGSRDNDWVPEPPQHGSSKTAESKRKSTAGSKGRLSSADVDPVELKEPTTSPYISMTNIDAAGRQDEGKEEVQGKSTGGGEEKSRPVSVAQSEASLTEQQTIARSVSSVTIRQKENVTPNKRSKPTSAAKLNKPASAGGSQVLTVREEDGTRGAVFMTDADSVVWASASPTPQHSRQSQRQQPPHQQQPQTGCKDFAEAETSHRDDDDDDDDDKDGGDNHQKISAHQTHLNINNGAASTNTESDNLQQVSSQSQKSGRQASGNKIFALADNSPEVAEENKTMSHRPTYIQATETSNTLQSKIDTITSNDHSTKRESSPQKRKTLTKLKQHEAALCDRSTFITAGFLTLDSMITKARNTLRHSYSLNDLDKSCDWGPTISSPRSVEVLNKTVVTFAENAKCHYYNPSREDDYNPENLQLTLYSDTDPSSLDTAIDVLDREEMRSNSPVPRRVVQTRGEVTAKRKPSCLDSIQRELAARDSKYGVHGEVSEFLTTRTLVRNVYPPSPKHVQRRACSSTHACESDLASSNLTSELNILSECHTPVNPPTTPLECSTPVSECPIAEWESLFDWESPEEDSKCFLERFIDFLPDTDKATTVEGNTDYSLARTRSPLPDAVEGQTKPVNPRQSKGVVEPIAAIAPACYRINALPPDGYVFYFAYDADMNMKRFSTLLGREIQEKRWALLFGFQLVFNKQGVDQEAGLFANIEANRCTSTEGAVYVISHDELAVVDGHHGYPDHYARLILPVWVCNSVDPDNYNIAQYCIPAISYIAQDRWILPQNGVPASKDYSLRQCINGSEQLTCGFKEHLSNMLQECGV